MSRRPRGSRAATLCLAVLVAGQSLAVYQLVFRAHGIPSFHRGGTFLAVGSPGRPVPYGTNDAAAGGSTSTAPATTVSVPPQPATGISVPPRLSAPSPEPVDDAAAPSAPAPSVAPLLPAAGTYTYAVEGSESASGFGSRSYPSTMTVTVHPSDDLPQSQIVLDLYLSEDHQEREILARTDAGLAFSFEGGSVTFGPGTQTSDADYDPPMVQVPADLTPGSEVTGSTTAKNPDGSVSRVEDWSVKVVGQEPVTVGGVSTDTWVVDVQRNSQAGSTDEVNRYRRYWYDPARALWVRWHEVFHGSRDMFGLTFSYDTDYTATLAG